MNEYTKKTLTLVLAAIALIACLWLVVRGHSVGFASGGLGIGGLLFELGGLAGILVLLGLYNHSYQ